MKQRTLLLRALALAMLLLIGAASGAYADLVTWGYDWSASPSNVTAGGGSVALSNESFHTAVGSSQVVATNLKVSGVSVFSAGDFIGADGSEAMLLSDVRRGTYKKLVIADGRLTSAVLIGDVGDALWYLDLIRNRKPIAGIRADMIFGRSLTLPLKAA